MSDSRDKPPRPGARPRATAAPGSSSWVPAAPRVRGAEPARLGDVLVGAQQILAQKTSALMTHDAWRQIVGAKIASRTRVGRLNRGTLVVHVASSAWSSELSFLQADIVRRLVAAGHEVTRLRFLVDQALSGGEQRRGPPRAPSQRTSDPLPPSLEARLAQIDDPNLRAAVAEAARWSLGRRR